MPPDAIFDASPAFRERLAAAWAELDAPTLEPLSGGLLHSTWRVHDPAGEFILQRVATAFSPDVHTNVERVTAHLADRGVESFRMLRTAAGELLWQDEGYGHRLLTAIPGVAFATCSGSDVAREAAVALARFHTALADFDAPLAELGFPYREPLRSFEALERAVERERAHPLHADVAALAQPMLDARPSPERDAALPVRVIHGDLKFSNVIFEAEAGPGGGRRARALVDLDTVLRRPLYHDLGDAWRSWCNRRPEDDPRAELDLAVFDASAAGYLDALGFALEPVERESLADALERLALELAARFATDALEEGWFGFDADRFERSGLHQLERARGQLALYEQARDARAHMRAALGLRAEG